MKNEKIWIPWRILEHNLNDFNFSGILFPIIKYYYRENKNEELKSKEISYKFCNETSMINESDNVLIDSSLDNLFCIDMDDLYMGGSFSTNYLYYIEFGLYICRNGMIYNVCREWIKNGMKETPKEMTDFIKRQFRKIGAKLNAIGIENDC